MTFPNVHFEVSGRVLNLVSWCIHAFDCFQTAVTVQLVNSLSHQNNPAALSGGVLVSDFFDCNVSKTQANVLTSNVNLLNERTQDIKDKVSMIFLKNIPVPTFEFLNKMSNRTNLFQ